MAKLPKDIIKKHGISKKAWQVFRARKGKTKRVKTKKSKVIHVARKRSKSRKKNSGFKIPSAIGAIIAPIAYGMVREDLSNRLANTELVKKLPLTTFTDEAVMLGVNWGAKKLGLGKIPIVSSILRSQKQIELARIGQAIKDMRTTNSSTNNAQSIHIN